MQTFIRRLIFGTVPLERPPQKASLRSLPNELLLEVFSFLELKPYIICHGVCRNWRELLPATQIHPIRIRLLDLYHRILETPDFRKTLEWTDRHLQPFNREQYIRCLLTQYPAIPEEFRMWILEWPARLVIQCTWPGLPFIHCRTISPSVRREGVNWIAYQSSSPQLSSLVYKQNTPFQTFIPGLFIWRHGTGADWLIFEHDDPTLYGRVFIAHAHDHSTWSIPFYPPREGLNDGESARNNSDDDIDTASLNSVQENLTVFEDWISYLDYLWTKTDREILHPRGIPIIYRDSQVPQPAQYEFNAAGSHLLPAPVWGFRERNVLSGE